MNQKWTRAICTVLTSALVFTGPAVEGTTFSGYINSGLEKVYAKTQKQKDAEKKKSQAEQNLKDKKNEINGLKDQQQTTADDIKNFTHASIINAMIDPGEILISTELIF